MKKTGRLFQKNKAAPSASMSLQITSMADIFTILLVFLLKGLASDVIQIQPANATTLPNSINSKTILETALQVEITKTEILVEKERVMTWKNPSGKFEDQLGLTELSERLGKEKEKQKLISENNDSVKNDERVILLADESVPYVVIKAVLRTMASRGYSEVKFAVVRD